MSQTTEENMQDLDARVLVYAHMCPGPSDCDESVSLHLRDFEDALCEFIAVKVKAAIAATREDDCKRVCDGCAEGFAFDVSGRFHQFYHGTQRIIPCAAKQIRKTMEQDNG
jgi:ribosomal protein L31